MWTLRSRIALGCMFLAAGCGGSGAGSLPNLVPVSGTVTYQGQPLAQGTVSFAPQDPARGQSAVGKIENGRFNMVTTASSPGAQTGKYKVAIISYEIDPNPPTQMPPPGTEIKPPKSLIPQKYTSIASSGLEVDVAPGMGPLSYELKD